MRKLNKKQKQKIEEYYHITKSTYMDSVTQDSVASLNWYENVYSDIDRYLNDFYFEKQSKNRDLF